jgi:HEAT repeat protein
VSAALTVADLVLAGMVAALAMAITAIRAVALHRRARERRLRPQAELALAGYLAGGPPLAAPASRDERAVLLAVALEALADLRGSERDRLAARLAELGYAGDARAGLAARRQAVRQRAAETLAALAIPELSDALAAGLADPDVLVRATCARTLAEVGSEADLPAVIAVAERDTAAAPGACAAIVLALGRHRPASLTRLLGPGARPEIRTTAITVAGELRLAGHVPLLRAALADPCDGIAAAAARGLGQIGEAAAVPELSRLALDVSRSPATRAAAATALGALGDPAARATLQRLLAGGDWQVLSAAAGALARLGGPGLATLRWAATAAGQPARQLAGAALAEAAAQ